LLQRLSGVGGFFTGFIWISTTDTCGYPAQIHADEHRYIITYLRICPDIQMMSRNLYGGHMRTFHPIIEELRSFVNQAKDSGQARCWKAGYAIHWPAAGPGDIVLLPDLALELGRPDDASLSFLVWTCERQRINDDAITLIGPDIQEADGGHLPFGKIVLAAIDEGDEEALYDRYRQMDLARFTMSLKGYMLRATSQYLREWSRISRQAIQNGFSFHILGSALIRELKAIAGVKTAEVIFVTRSARDVNALQETGIRVSRMIQAMNKMINEMEPDCDSCEYQDVCDRASEMIDDIG